MRMRAGGAIGMLLLALAPGLPGGSGAAAQELADYDYENLSFRGVSVEGGWIFPNNVETTSTIGARIDLGYLGPGFRITPRFTYWSSDLDGGEIRQLEDRLVELIARENPPGTPLPTVNLAPIEWSDVVIGLDGHFAWNLPGRVLSYVGTGVAAHILNGKGTAIEGTFVEDLLDTVRAGFNLHVGFEYPLNERFRLYTEGRGEILDDLRYLGFRLGGQVFFGSPPPIRGEGR